MTAIHAPALRTTGVVAAGVASSSPESAVAPTVRLGLGQDFSSVEQLLADDSIAVVPICTCNTSRAELELTEAAIGAGRHVICKNSLVTSAAEAAVVGIVPFEYRVHPTVREARSRVRNGQAGRPVNVQSSSLQDWLLASEANDWRADEKSGGPSRAFADIRSQLCDLIELVLDDPIQRLTALTRTIFGRRGSTTEVGDIPSVLSQQIRALSAGS